LVPRKKSGRYKKIGGQTGPIKHGLYMSPSQLDGRTWVAKMLKKIRTGLLEGFPDPPPIRVQIIADLCSVKIFQVNCYKANVLTGLSDSNQYTEITCLALMNSITRDIMALDQLAKNHAPKDRVPSLQEYLEAIKEKNVVLPEIK